MRNLIGGCTNIENVDIQGANDALKAADTVKAQLPANPDINGIFTASEGSAIGLVVAIKDAGDQIVGVRFDSGKTQKEPIMGGSLMGAISENPVGVGQCIVDSLAKVIK